MDFLNSLYNGSTISDFYRFYSSFSNHEELIDWMEKRPKGNPRPVTINGNKDIVVIIPTMNINSKFAENCRKDIYKGLQMIFVESGHDEFFNYSHSLNIGYKEALKYDPKWIIFSNDDMYSIDKSIKLTKQLHLLDHNKTDVVYTDPPGDYHSYLVKIGESSIYRELSYNFSKNLKEKLKMEHIFKKQLLLKYQAIEAKFPFGILIKGKTQIFNIGSFSIFSNNFIIKFLGDLFDENYINGYEDLDLSIRLNKLTMKKAFINYRIGDLRGMSLGKFTSDRTYRSLVNISYFNYKILNGMLSI